MPSEHPVIGEVADIQMPRGIDCNANVLIAAAVQSQRGRIYRVRRAVNEVRLAEHPSRDCAGVCQSDCASDNERARN